MGGGGGGGGVNPCGGGGVIGVAWLVVVLDAADQYINQSVTQASNQRTDHSINQPTSPIDYIITDRSSESDYRPTKQSTIPPTRRQNNEPSTITQPISMHPSETNQPISRPCRTKATEKERVRQTTPLPPPPDSHSPRLSAGWSLISKYTKRSRFDLLPDRPCSKIRVRRSEKVLTRP